MNNLEKIFRIVSFYDNCRWSDAKNYNSINFYKEGLDDDTKLLTHWLCYITDRQMDFERIWDVGGFVFSELAEKYKNIADNDNILIPKMSNSFIREDEDDERIKKIKYSFIGLSRPNNIIVEKYSNVYENNNSVVFKSRYLPSDYYNILYTFDLLNKYERSLSYFIAQAYRANKKDKEHLIHKILFSLYLLTYYYEKNGQPNYEDILNDNISVGERTKRVIEILNTDEIFENEFNTFLKTKIFQQKRAWCSLRDFLKSPEYGGYFRNTISKYLSEDEIKELTSETMLHQLELPGDVWNNNSIFRKCVLKRTDYEDSTDGFNVLLRKFYNSNPKSDMKAYPEQFDITFDFVPRMCNKGNCDICPIGFISGKGGSFEMTCIDNNSKYCPVVLVGCGYFKRCIGHQCCELRKVV